MNEIGFGTKLSSLGRQIVNRKIKVTNNESDDSDESSLSEEQIKLLQKKIARHKKKTSTPNNNYNDSSDDKKLPANIQSPITNSQLINTNPVAFLTPNLVLRNDVFFEPAIDEYSGEKIQLHFLVGKYDWNALDPDLFCSSENVIPQTVLPNDLLPINRKITNEDVTKWCIFNKREPNEENIDMCSESLTSLNSRIGAYILHLLYVFWIDISNKLGLRHNNDSLIASKEDLLQAIKSIQTMEQAKLLMILLYLVFDFMDDWQQSFHRMIERKFNIIVNVPIKGEKRQTVDFLFRYITKVLHESRKSIEKYTKRLIGLKFTVRRKGRPEIKELMGGGDRKKNIFTIG
jgi:hypothetical protein